MAVEETLDLSDTYRKVEDNDAWTIYREDTKVDTTNTYLSPS